MKRAAKLLITLSLAWAYGQAQASTTYNYYITQSNTTPPFADGADYGRVKIVDTGSVLNFTVTLGAALSSYASAEIDGFAFNTGTGVTFSNLLSNWTGAYSANSLSMDGFGKFDARVDYNGQANVQTLTFTASPSTPINFNSFGNCGQGCTWFAMHVKQLTPDGSTVTSAYFGSGIDPTLPPASVPVPAAAWLLGSGLLGLVGVSRRKAI